MSLCAWVLVSLCAWVLGCLCACVLVCVCGATVTSRTICLGLARMSLQTSFALVASTRAIFPDVSSRPTTTPRAPQHQQHGMECFLLHDRSRSTQGHHSIHKPIH